MDYLETYSNERRWINKARIMNVFHCSQLLANEKWRVEDTAKFFGKSKALVSENLALAQNQDVVHNCRTREEALLLVRGLKIK